MRPTDFSDAGRCPTCGKFRYTSKRNAKTRARNFDRTLSAYRCGDYWHLGHLGQVVKQGHLARSDLRRPT